MNWIKQHPFESALIAIVAFLHLPVIFSHENYLLSWFNIDDGYYYFVTARNIAAGKGITFDGLTRSNGFHPLWMFLITPIFGLPGKLLPLRVLTALLTAITAATGVTLFRLTSRYLAHKIAFLTALTFILLPKIHSIATRGGMEAGLSALLIALTLYQLDRVDLTSKKRVLTLSVIASLMFLARLDNIFLAGFVGLWLILKVWSQPWATRIKVATWFGLPLLLVLVLYLGWNQIGFGTPTPVSGQVKRWWGTLENTVYGFPPREFKNYVGQFVTDDESIGPWSLFTRPLYASAELLVGEENIAGRRVALAAIGLGLVSAVAVVARKQRTRIWRAVQGIGLLPLLLGCLFQIGYYKAGGSVAEKGWYWILEMMWLVLVAGVLVDGAWQMVKSKIENRKPAHRSVAFNFRALLLGLVALAILSPHLPRLGQILSPEIATRESFYLTRSAWLEANTPTGAVIGMTGSGSAAYYTTDRTFINLDGLISSYEYFQAMKNGTAHEFLADLGVAYIFGNSYIIQESDPYAAIFEQRITEIKPYENGTGLILWQFQP